MLVYKYQLGRKSTESDALLRIPLYRNNPANDHTSEIAHLVYNSYITKVPVLLKYVKGD